MVLAGMVSSKIWMSPPETITRSSQSNVAERLVGTLAGGLLLAPRPWRSAYKVLDGLRVGMHECLRKCLQDRIMVPGIYSLV